jgi:glycosyltransferase involved in cell wall biosynthesis
VRIFQFAFLILSDSISAMTLFSLDIVIPIIPVHHKFLPKLLRSFESASVLPNQVIIAASSQTHMSLKFLNSITENSRLCIKILATKNLHTAGSNRNRGWEFCESEYISFCDADDTYSKKRIEVLNSIANKFNPELILHNYSILKPQLFLEYSGRSEIFLTEAVLYGSTFSKKIRNNHLENGLAGDTNICLPAGSRKNWKIHHGHATIKRTVTERYGSLPFGEDGQICKDILFNGHKVVYTPQKLSNYHRPTFFNITKKSFSRIHSNLAEIKRSFLGRK